MTASVSRYTGMTTLIRGNSRRARSYAVTAETALASDGLPHERGETKQKGSDEQQLSRVGQGGVCRTCNVRRRRRRRVEHRRSSDDRRRTRMPRSRTAVHCDRPLCFYRDGVT